MDAVADYDRMAELKAFDDTKGGVKGLLDAGVTSVPRIFHVPSDDPIHAAPVAAQDASRIPVIDLRGDLPEVVEEIRRATAEWGFFQVVGHGVPAEVMEGMIEGVRRFSEGDESAKAALYSREPLKKVKFNSNFDLYESRVANWRDTLFCCMAPDPPAPEELPASCRDITMEYSKKVAKLGETLFGLLSQALGLRSNHLKDLECCKGQILLCHYYPPCPQPELVIGSSPHSDASFLSVLLQDQLGGLQVLYDGRWVDVPHIPGAFIVNVGDLLQLISNEKFISVEHRVLANKKGPRISIACFFAMHFCATSTILYGPIEELLDEKNPPLYRKTLLRDYVVHYYSKGLSGKSALSDFRL